MQQEQAEGVALRALAWIAADDALLPTFMDQTGIAPTALARAAAEPEVLGAVLDFVLSRDAWVVDFAESAAIPPGMVAAARSSLPGGDVVHWT